MKVKLLRSLGTALAKSLSLDGEASGYTEGKTVEVPEAAAERLCELKLAERSEKPTRVTAPAKAPEITGK